MSGLAQGMKPKNAPHLSGALNPLTAVDRLFLRRFVGFLALDFDARGNAAVFDGDFRTEFEITINFAILVAGDLPFLVPLLDDDRGIGKFKDRAGDLIGPGLRGGLD